jgi:signal peptidase I
MQDQNSSQPAIPTSTSEPSEKPATHDGWRSALSTIAILLIAPLVAVFLTAFVFQSYQVDGPSMQTTLQNSDRLVVWKLPRTWARLTGHQYAPRRGDIIVFNESNLSTFGQGESKQLIKRVIGLPGERVTVENGVLTVFNSDHPNGFRPDAEMAYGKVIGDTQPESGATSWTLQKGQIFVSGDNRPDSLDSRAFGPVALDDVVGKLIARILPLGSAQRF